MFLCGIYEHVRNCIQEDGMLKYHWRVYWLQILRLQISFIFVWEVLFVDLIIFCIWGFVLWITIVLPTPKIFLRFIFSIAFLLKQNEKFVGICGISKWICRIEKRCMSLPLPLHLDNRYFRGLPMQHTLSETKKNQLGVRVNRDNITLSTHVEC